MEFTRDRTLAPDEGEVPSGGFQLRGFGHQRGAPLLQNEPPFEALFTSLRGGEALRGRVLQVIQEATNAASQNHVDLHIMTFSFTDEEIANALVEAAMSTKSLSIRILADWSQRGRASGQQMQRLAALPLPNLCVRYKKDQPYMWDPAAGHIRWSYRASRGLLHHKTLGVIVNGIPWKLVCGSFNWTAHGARSYENLLVVNAGRPGSRELMARVELEFEALWADGRATLSPEEADAHHRAITEAFQRDPMTPPEKIAGLESGQGEIVSVLAPAHLPVTEQSDASPQAPGLASEPEVSIAFSSRHIWDGTVGSGYAEANRKQRLWLYKPSTKVKRAPLTLTTLALQTIFRARTGDTLKVAMFGLSPRVPEYGALLDAARRGVRVSILLDGRVNAGTALRLLFAQCSEHLPIEVRAGCRMMHQKYVIHPESASVLTGTANMTTDASARHSEQRILIRGFTSIVEEFSADFDTIWKRLSQEERLGSI